MITPRHFLLAACALFSACSQEPGTEAATAATAAPDTPTPTPTRTPLTPGGAQLTFSEIAFDFGVVPDTETLLHRFEFANQGDAPLSITNTKASCGCTIPKLEKTLFAPGEGSQIDVSWDPKGFGKQTQTVKITSNSRSNGLVVLRITAFVEPFLKLNPATIAFGAVPQSLPATRIVSIDCDSKELVIDSITTTHVNVSARLLAPAVDGRAQMEVSLLPGAPWGMFFPKVKITARERAGGKQSVREVPVSANPYHDLRFDPPNFPVGRIGLGKPFRKELTVTRPGGGPFTIIEASVVGSPVPDLNVTIEPQPGGASVKLVLQSNGWAAEAKLARARVRVVTDVPGDQERLVPVFGIVGPPVK